MKVYVKFDPLYERVICVHEVEDQSCPACQKIYDEDRKCYHVEGNWYEVNPKPDGYVTRISYVKVIEPFVIEVEFTNGEVRRHDLSLYKHHPQYAEHFYDDEFYKYKISSDGLDLMWGDYNMVFASSYLYGC